MTAGEMTFHVFDHHLIGLHVSRHWVWKVFYVADTRTSAALWFAIFFLPVFICIFIYLFNSTNVFHFNKAKDIFLWRSFSCLVYAFAYVFWEVGIQSGPTTWTARTHMLEPWPAMSQGSNCQLEIGTEQISSPGTRVWSMDTLSSIWIH